MKLPRRKSVLDTADGVSEQALTEREVNELSACATVSDTSWAARSQPTFPNSCRTSEGESSRQPSSAKRLPVRYQWSPLALLPPCSNSIARRLSEP